MASSTIFSNLGCPQISWKWRLEIIRLIQIIGMKRMVLVAVMGEIKKNVDEVLGKRKGVNEKFALKCMLTKG